MTDAGCSDSDWTSVAPTDLLDALAAHHTANAVAVIAVDGRSRSGKTTLADLLSTSCEHVAVIHTDDIAWHHSFFDWSEVVIDGVLAPLRRLGPPLSFVPTPWTQRGRAGSINIRSCARVVIVEGVGAARRELMPWLDATVWVDTDEAVAMGRTVALDRDPPGFVRDWMTAERAHLDLDQPWTRATAIVSGERPMGPHRHLWVRRGPGTVTGFKNGGR